MSKRRIEKGFVLAVAAAALIVTALLGSWAYVASTTTPLHPRAQDAPAVTHSRPSPAWADLEQRVPVSPDTQFRIGTASTVLTAAAVGLLLEQGRLALDDEIQTRVPAFPRRR